MYLIYRNEFRKTSGVPYYIPVIFGQLISHPVPHLLWYPDEVRERRGVFDLGRGEVLVDVVLQVLIVENIVLGVDYLDLTQEAFPCCFFKGTSVALLDGRLGSKWMSA